MLEDAIRYPTRGESGLERLLIGGVLTVLSVFVLPAFLVYGYLVRSLAAVARGEEEPPAFEDWAGLFVDGLKAFVVAFVYGVVPVVLAVAFFVPVGARVIQIARGMAIVVAVVLTLGLVLIVLVPLGAFLNFWVYLATVYLFGDAYREAMGQPTRAA